MSKTFPQGFLWGSATASYQCEGGWDCDGRGLSMWDSYTHENNLKNGDVACDHYHRYREDLALMKEMGHNTYRFSIAWPRILPDDSGRVNEAGVQFYLDLIAECHKLGIEPNVTLYHWDLPDYLQQQGGWENRQTIDAYLAFSRVCFERFGSVVKLWVTINEPTYFTICGYGKGNYPPNVRDLSRMFKALHHVMLASARCAKLFRELRLSGQIGLVHAYEPAYILEDTAANRRARDYADLFYNYCALDPALRGSYDATYLQMLREQFTDSFILPGDAAVLADGVVDFLGVNYYCRTIVQANNKGDTVMVIHNSDNPEENKNDSVRVKDLFEIITNPHARYTAWNMEIYPEGLYEALMMLRERYGNLPMYISENGIGFAEQPTGERVEDDTRIAFLEESLLAAHKAIEQGVDLHGYYVWSTMDLYSWINGYNKRYGLIYIDYENGLRRVPKKSFYWYKRVAESNGAALGGG